MKISGKKLQRDFIGIFHCAIVCSYTWLLITFFWELQSFLMRLSVNEILAFLSYQFAFSLIESFIVAVIAMTVSLIIPGKSVKENLQVMGGSLVFSFTANALIIKLINQPKAGPGPATEIVQTLLLKYPQVFINTTAFIILFIALGTPVFSAISTRNPKFSNAMKAFIENLSVLGAIYTTLGVIGVIIIIIRNLS